MTGVDEPTLARLALAEGVGTSFLVLAIVGSGIAASNLSPNDVGLQLLENSIVTGAVLIALILALHPVSAAFNPIITLVELALRRLTTTHAICLVAAQIAGGLVGAVLANLMYELPAITIASTDRRGGGHLLAETLATLGLVLVVFAAGRRGQALHVALAVGSYIAAAYWFASSTSFANPAVTVARTLSDTFAGIAVASAAPFLAAQVVGGVLGAALVVLVHPGARRRLPTSPAAHRVTSDRAIEE